MSDDLEDRLRARLPSLAGLGYRVRFETDDDAVYVIDGTVTPPVLSRGDEDADTTLRLSTSDLEKLIDGDLNPTLAYTLGKLKVDGSMGVALKLASMLDE